MTDKENLRNESFSWKDLLKAIIQILGDKKKIYFFYEIILILLLLLTTVPPLIMGKIIDFFTNYSHGQPLTLFYIYVTILTGVQIIGSYLRLTTKRILGDIHSTVAYSTRVSGFNKLMDLSLTWHDSEITGNKFQRIQNGITEAGKFMRIVNGNIFLTIANVIGIISVFILLKPIYAVLVIVYILVFLNLLKHYYLLTMKLQDEQNKAIEQASGAYVEGIGNILTIKSSGAQKNFGLTVSKTELVRKQYEILIRRIGIQKWQAFQAFNGVAIALFLLVVGYDITRDALTIGSIVIVSGYIQQLVGRATEILDNYEQMIQSKSGIGRMMSILNSTEIPVGGTQKFPKSWENINLSRATFSYPSKDDKTFPDLKNVFLTIKKYQRIGIVGKTGSGKSTIAKILMGLYQLDYGTYKIGETNFYDINHDYVTDHVAIVLQDSEMFNLSIKENITLMRAISPELFERAIHISQLESVIEKLPNGLETIIGEKGYHLSGGERQRVGIARAICRDPEIIIFDEATSSLDSQTESKIQSSLERELTKKTLIFIAHRISTLKNTDNIYVFQEGSIAEQGTFQKLLTNKKSLFSQLYSLQEKN